MGKDFDYDNLPRNTQIELAGRIAKDNLEKSNAQYTLPEIKETFYSKYGKRIIDIILSGLAIIVSLPINLIIAIVTFFDVGHPIFFCQKRMGKNCKLFSLIKFRNMTNKTDQDLCRWYIRADSINIMNSGIRSDRDLTVRWLIRPSL